MLQNHIVVYLVHFFVQPANHFSFSSIGYDALIMVEATKLYLSDFDFHFCEHRQNVMWTLWKEEFQRVTIICTFCWKLQREIYEKLKTLFFFLVYGEIREALSMDKRKCFLQSARMVGCCLPGPAQRTGPTDMLPYSPIFATDNFPGPPVSVFTASSAPPPPVTASTRARAGWCKIKAAIDLLPSRLPAPASTRPLHHRRCHALPHPPKRPHRGLL